jgi:hypothetical protein
MLLRIVTDPRVSLDPARAGEIPATLVLAINDALDLRDEAERQAMERR